MSLPETLSETNRLVRVTLDAAWEGFDWLSVGVDGYVPTLHYPGFAATPNIHQHHGVVQFTGLQGRSVGFTEGAERRRSGQVLTVLHRYPVGHGEVPGESLTQHLLDSFMLLARVLKLGTHNASPDGEVRGALQHRLTVEFDYDRFIPTR